VADEDVLAAGAMIDLLSGSADLPDEFRPHLATSPSDFAHQSFLETRSDLYLAMTRAKNGARLLAIPELQGMHKRIPAEALPGVWPSRPLQRSMHESPQKFGIFGRNLIAAPRTGALHWGFRAIQKILDLAWRVTNLAA
jgi:hypothetical protein